MLRRAPNLVFYRIEMSRATLSPVPRVQHSSLRSLCVINNGINNETESLLDGMTLPSTTSLSVYSILGVRGDSLIGLIRRSGAEAKIVDLDVSTDSAPTLISLLSQLSALQRFNLDQSVLKKEEIVAIVRALKSSSVRQVSLTYKLASRGRVKLDSIVAGALRELECEVRVGAGLKGKL